MAAVPLNRFKTFTKILSTTPEELYPGESDYTTIILMAQISNTTATTKKVTFSHVSGATSTQLLEQFSIPPYDAVSAITGKLVLESGQTITAYANVDASVKVVLSVLETLNG